MPIQEKIQAEMQKQGIKTVKELSKRTGVRYGALIGFFKGKSLSTKNLDKVIDSLNSVQLFSENSLKSTHEINELISEMLTVLGEINTYQSQIISSLNKIGILNKNIKSLIEKIKAKK